MVGRNVPLYEINFMLRSKGCLEITAQTLFTLQRIGSGSHASTYIWTHMCSHAHILTHQEEHIELAGVMSIQSPFHLGEGARSGFSVDEESFTKPCPME